VKALIENMCVYVGDDLMSIDVIATGKPQISSEIAQLVAGMKRSIKKL